MEMVWRAPLHAPLHELIDLAIRAQHLSTQVAESDRGAVMEMVEAGGGQNQSLRLATRVPPYKWSETTLWH